MALHSDLERILNYTAKFILVLSMKSRSSRYMWAYERLVKDPTASFLAGVVQAPPCVGLTKGPSRVDMWGSCGS